MKKHLGVKLMFTTLMACGLAGCPEKRPDGDFAFTIQLESGKSTLEIGDKDKIVVNTNGIDDTDRTYTYSINGNSSYASLGTPEGTYCPVTAEAIGKVTFVCKEERSGNQAVLSVDITDNSDPANGGYNYASTSGAEAIATRTEILGKLEKYAVESHLTGITLFENGGYVKYSSRLDIPTEEYITGYGFGILSEGNITEDLPGEENANFKRYYHSAQSSNPGKINAADDTGSQVSDLSGYVTSPYLFTGLMAVLALSGAAMASSDTAGVEVSNVGDSERVRVIVEVSKGLNGLSQEEVTLSQNKVFNSIKTNITRNVELVDRYHVLNNAILMVMILLVIEALF